MLELRMPQIAGSEREQLSQIRSYLYQIVPQLQWALNTLEGSGGSNYVVQQIPKVATRQTTSIDSEVAFNSLKPLIIKSADIVNAYYEEINSRLESIYVAESDFGTFTEQNTQTLNQNASGIEQLFTNVQKISTDIENLNFTLAEVNAHIKSGILYYDDDGLPVYGLEIGQQNTVDGEEVFDKFARFTSDRLSFYDQNGSEVAYVSDYKLYITNAEITGILKLGAFRIDTTEGIRLKYVGRG